MRKAYDQISHAFRAVCTRCKRIALFETDQASAAVAKAYRDGWRERGKEMLCKDCFKESTEATVV